MVANLTRFTACTVHPDSPDKPVPDRKAEHETASADPRARADRKDQTGDEPVRLFAWVSA